MKIGCDVRDIDLNSGDDRRRCDHCGDFIDPIDWCPGCIKADGPCRNPHVSARKRADARYCDDECSREARKPY